TPCPDSSVDTDDGSTFFTSARTHLPSTSLEPSLKRSAAFCTTGAMSGAAATDSRIASSPVQPPLSANAYTPTPSSSARPTAPAFGPISAVALRLRLPARRPPSSYPPESPPAPPEPHGPPDPPEPPGPPP